MGAVLAQRNCQGKGGPSRSAPAAGFTLIEVLVALVVVSVGLVAVLRTFHGSAASADEARAHLHADRLLRMQWAAFQSERAAQPDRPPRSGSGAFAPPNADYRWEREVAAADLGTVDGHELQGLHEIQFRVWRRDRPESAHRLRVWVHAGAPNAEDGS